MGVSVHFVLHNVASTMLGFPDASAWALVAFIVVAVAWRAAGARYDWDWEDDEVVSIRRRTPVPPRRRRERQSAGLGSM